MAPATAPSKSPPSKPSEPQDPEHDDIDDLFEMDVEYSSSSDSSDNNEEAQQPQQTQQPGQSEQPEQQEQPLLTAEQQRQREKEAALKEQQEFAALSGGWTRVALKKTPEPEELEQLSEDIKRGQGLLRNPHGLGPRPGQARMIQQDTPKQILEQQQQQEGQEEDEIQVWPALATAPTVPAGDAEQSPKSAQKKIPPAVVPEQILTQLLRPTARQVPKAVSVSESASVAAPAPASEQQPKQPAKKAQHPLVLTRAQKDHIARTKRAAAQIQQSRQAPKPHPKSAQQVSQPQTLSLGERLVLERRAEEKVAADAVAAAQSLTEEEAEADAAAVRRMNATLYTRDPTVPYDQVHRAPPRRHQQQQPDISRRPLRDTAPISYAQPGYGATNPAVGNAPRSASPSPFTSSGNQAPFTVPGVLSGHAPVTAMGPPPLPIPQRLAGNPVMLDSRRWNPYTGLPYPDSNPVPQELQNYPSLRPMMPSINTAGDGHGRGIIPTNSPEYSSTWEVSPQRNDLALNNAPLPGQNRVNRPILQQQQQQPPPASSSESDQEVGDTVASEPTGNNSKRGTRKSRRAKANKSAVRYNIGEGPWRSFPLGGDPLGFDGPAIYPAPLVSIPDDWIEYGIRWYESLATERTEGQKPGETRRQYCKRLRRNSQSRELHFVERDSTYQFEGTGPRPADPPGAKTTDRRKNRKKTNETTTSESDQESIAHIANVIETQTDNYLQVSDEDDMPIYPTLADPPNENQAPGRKRNRDDSDEDGDQTDNIQSSGQQRPKKIPKTAQAAASSEIQRQPAKRVARQRQNATASAAPRPAVIPTSIPALAPAPAASTTSNVISLPNGQPVTADDYLRLMQELHRLRAQVEDCQEARRADAELADVREAEMRRLRAQEEHCQEARRADAVLADERDAEIRELRRQIDEMTAENRRIVDENQHIRRTTGVTWTIGDIAERYNKLLKRYRELKRENAKLLVQLEQRISVENHKKLWAIDRLSDDGGNTNTRREVIDLTADDEDQEDPDLRWEPIELVIRDENQEIIALRREIEQLQDQMQRQREESRRAYETLGDHVVVQRDTIRRMRDGYDQYVGIRRWLDDYVPEDEQLFDETTDQIHNVFAPILWHQDDLRGLAEVQDNDLMVIDGENREYYEEEEQEGEQLRTVDLVEDDEIEEYEEEEDDDDNYDEPGYRSPGSDSYSESSVD